MPSGQQFLEHDLLHSDDLWVDQSLSWDPIRKSALWACYTLEHARSGRGVCFILGSSGWPGLSRKKVVMWVQGHGDTAALLWQQVIEWSSVRCILQNTFWRISKFWFILCVGKYMRLRLVLRIMFEGGSSLENIILNTGQQSSVLSHVIHGFKVK